MMIVGIDEVGRGPWAGPLVIGAVALGDSQIEGLTDSKKLSKKRREELAAQIVEKSATYGLGWVSAHEIDEIGLSAALTLATKRALEQITIPYHEIIIDGTINFLKGTGKGEYVTTLKKADLLIAAVSAASIIAKVARDDYMHDVSKRYPGYGFETHVGYGTAAHTSAIQRLGITEEHRKSFAPIAAIVSDGGKAVASIAGTNKHTGILAESVAAKWLIAKGYEIVERNWQTKFCEIDIIASKNSVLYFVEVKHRKSQQQGGGIAAITPKKLRQMKFSAQLYLTSRPNHDAQLAVITTSGSSDIQVDEFLKLE